MRKIEVVHRRRDIFGTAARAVILSDQSQSPVAFIRQHPHRRALPAMHSRHGSHARPRKPTEPVPALTSGIVYAPFVQACWRLLAQRACHAASIPHARKARAGRRAGVFGVSWGAASAVGRQGQLARDDRRARPPSGARGRRGQEQVGAHAGAVGGRQAPRAASRVARGRAAPRGRACQRPSCASPAARRAAMPPACCRLVLACAISVATLMRESRGRTRKYCAFPVACWRLGFAAHNRQALCACFALRRLKHFFIATPEHPFALAPEPPSARFAHQGSL